MRTVAIDILPNTRAPPIELVCNKVEPVFVETRLALKKYKKVSKEARARLLRCIEKGWSIINVPFHLTQVSKKFGINYSTAKSIVQNQKKKALKGDTRNSSTESFHSEEGEDVL